MKVERHTMFMDDKIRYYKDVGSPVHKFSTVPIKIPIGIFMELIN